MSTDTKDAGLQRIDLKLPLELPRDHDPEALLAIFGRWRHEEGEEIIDLADYLHVPDGPGCLLVSQRWHFGIDYHDGEPGLWISMRKGLEGSLEERLVQSLRLLLEKGERLLGEPEIAAGTRPRGAELDVVFNDRLLAPATAEGNEAHRPAVEALAARLFPEGALVGRHSEPGRRLGYRLRAKAMDSTTLSELAARL